MNLSGFCRIEKNSMRFKRIITNSITIRRARVYSREFMWINARKFKRIRALHLVFDRYFSSLLNTLRRPLTCKSPGFYNYIRKVIYKCILSLMKTVINAIPRSWTACLKIYVDLRMNHDSTLRPFSVSRVVLFQNLNFWFDNIIFNY